MPMRPCLPLLAVALLMFSADARAQRTAPPIIPTPQQWSWHDGALPLSSLDRILLIGDACEDARSGAEMLVSALRETHDVQATISCLEEAEAPQGGILIAAPHAEALQRAGLHAGDFTEEMEAEGYLLDVGDEQIRIAGKTAAGRFYGAMSLLQMLRGAEASLPRVTVQDYPEMGFRGISDDFSRGQVSTMENFKEIIRFLAVHKMNTFMPYMEDVMEFDAYPSIGEGRGALSDAELRELQRYAAARHVEVIPIFQTLGHYENILNMDRFAKYAEYPGAASLNTQSEEAFGFLTDLLDEVVPVFESEYFHIGADESWDVGRGASREAVAEKGIATVHADWYRKVYDYVRERGKTALMYGDRMLRYPDILEQIPEDIIVVDWHYGVSLDYPSTEVFSEAGQPFIVSPGVQNWNHVFPDHAGAWANIHNLTLDGARDGALGAITSNWGDYGGPNFRELNYRGYAYGAETSWNPDGADGASIDRRFNQLYYGSDRSELQAAVDLLVRLGQDASFPLMWRHPYNVIDAEGWGLLRRLETRQQTSRTALRLLEELEGDLPRNSRHLAYHRFAARLFGWQARLVEYALWMQQIADEAPEERQTQHGEALARGGELLDTLGELKERYRELWLRTNRPANLHRIMELFDYQQAYLQEMQEAVEGGTWKIQHELQSALIAAAAEAQEGSTSYLRTTFQIPEGREIEAAYLQLLGDTHADLWLNDTRVGGVRGTRSLSLWIENQRVKYWNVADRLEPGTNVLAARATSYRDERPGAANVLLEVHYADGSVDYVRSDSAWRASTQQEDGWTLAGFDASGWEQAVITSLPRRISPPLFSYGLPSRIEF